MNPSLPEVEIVTRIRTELFGGAERDLVTVYLYGSAARGALRRDSDVDLAFLGPSSPDSLQVQRVAGLLAQELRREVDLVDLRRAPTVLRAQVVSKGRCLHRGDPEAADLFEMYSLSDYATLCEERRPVVEAMLTRHRRA